MEKGNNGHYTGMFKYLLVGASFVVIVAGMKAAQTILVPFLLSIFISVISSPLLFWLRRKGLPMWAALLFVIVIVLLAGALVVFLIGASLNDFTQSIPLYEDRLKSKISEISHILSRVGITLPDKEILEYVDPGVAMNFASGLLSGLGNVLRNGFLILFTVIFILLEAATFQSKLSHIMDSSKKKTEFFENFYSNINRYMVIKTWISLVTGVSVGLWLAVLGIDYAILWGLLAFLLNYVPNIGSIIAAIPPILLALVQIGPLHAFLALTGFLVVNVTVGNIIEPRIMGKGLGLSTLIVFLSLVFWGWVLGPVGMLLSIPLTTAMKIAFSSSEETLWIGTLMGSGPVVEIFEKDHRDTTEDA